MLTYCITGLPRVQWEDSRYAMIDQFTHFPVISLECGATQVTELSSGEMFRVHEKHGSLPVIRQTSFSDI
jgi:hypothetical protein